MKEFCICAGSLMSYSGCASEVIIPAGVFSIAPRAFFGRKSIRRVIMPEGLERIGDSAFQDCSGLEFVSLPESLKMIRTDAFRGCENLGSIRLPDGLSQIDGGAFHGCPRLRFDFIPSNLWMVRDNSFDVLRSIRELEIRPRSDSGAVRVILSRVPAQARLVAHPDMWTATARITGPGRVAAGYADKVLAGSVSAEEAARFMDYVTKRRKRLLADLCDYPSLACYMTQHGLIRIDEIEELCGEARESRNAEVSAMLADYSDRHFSQADFDRLFDKQLNADPTSVTEVRKLWTVSECGEKEFRTGKYKGRDADPIVPERVKDGVVTVLEGSFDGRSDIKSVSLPKTLKTIGRRSFRKCARLAEITIPEGVSLLGEGCFEDCASLRSIVIPKGVKTIPDHAFYGCLQLESVTLPEGIEEIGNYAFCSCWNLRSVYLPDSVNVIHSYAFTDCKKLEDVNMAAKTRMSRRAFNTPFRLVRRGARGSRKV